jgi:hypothetical protein
LDLHAWRGAKGTHRPDSGDTKITLVYVNPVAGFMAESAAAGSRSSLTYAGPENINEPDIVYSFRL